MAGVGNRRIRVLTITTSIIGSAIRRREGDVKVTGAATYVDDLTFPDMLFGATVRSHIPRGKIRGIRFGEDIPWQEFTIVSAQDIPGANVVASLYDDQPCLAYDQVNHAEEPILLLAHPDPYLLERARQSVFVDIEPLPAVLTLEESLACHEVIWGQDNVFKRFEIKKGDPDSAWQNVAWIVEGTYSTESQEQLYIEPNGMIAQADETNCLTIWGSMQCPYYVQHAVKKVFGLEDHQVRVIQVETGGGFGGKEDYPSMIAAHAALLAWKSRKPVKLIYDRAEDMVATPKRHPARVRHRTAITHEGKLLAMEIDFLIDGGAYATLSPVVLSRGGIHAAGPYYCPNTHITCRAVATNTPPNGAFRGFGAPQTLFAVERHMDKIAGVLGLPPEELRRRNFICKGQTTATGQEMKEEPGLAALLDRALAESDYYAKKNHFLARNAGTSQKRGIGLSTFYHGAGFTGSGERYLASVAAVEILADGCVKVLTSSTEMGQGTNTVLAQIAAEALGLPVEYVEAIRPDTAVVPNSGPTVASRTCMIVGRLIEKASLELKYKLQNSGLLAAHYSPAQFTTACSAYIRDYGGLRTSAQYEPPPGIHWDDDGYSGDAYGTFAWSVHVAQVSIDSITCEVNVEDFVAVQEVGKVINPLMATGQIAGGVTQGIGFALYEKVVFKNGRMENSQMTNYIVPASVDVPNIRVFFVEKNYPHGPMGAKGIGELPIDGPAPAIVSAIQNATGVDLGQIPVTPELLMRNMEALRAHDTHTSEHKQQRTPDYDVAHAALT
jgi:CO/xanthine dehydrogenase Mo-binding subunit